MPQRDYSIEESLQTLSMVAGRNTDLQLIRVVQKLHVEIQELRDLRRRDLKRLEKVEQNKLTMVDT